MAGVLGKQGSGPLPVSVVKYLDNFTILPHMWQGGFSIPFIDHVFDRTRSVGRSSVGISISTGLVIEQRCTTPARGVPQLYSAAHDPAQQPDHGVAIHGGRCASRAARLDTTPPRPWCRK